MPPRPVFGPCGLFKEREADRLEHGRLNRCGLCANQSRPVHSHASDQCRTGRSAACVGVGITCRDEDPFVGLADSGSTGVHMSTSVTISPSFPLVSFVFFVPFSKHNRLLHVNANQSLKGKEAVCVQTRFIMQCIVRENSNESGWNSF